MSGAVRLARAWLPAGEAEDVFVAWDDDQVICEVRPGRSSDGPPVAGLVLPGLVNAHAHLELSHLQGAVPGGDGFLRWLDRLWQAPQVPTATDAGARAAFDAGTAWISDVSNRGDTAAAITRAGLGGVVHHELLGFHRAGLDELAARARAIAQAASGPIVVRPSPHALLSTPVGVVEACLHAGAHLPPATIHLGECEDEAQLLLDGTGGVAALLDRLGRDWRWWRPPGASPTAHLHAHGLLGPGLLLVHGVHLDAADVELIGAARSPLCLCPRSNLHIGGRLPDLRRLIDRGVTLAIGTDSLASTPDLDLLGEVRALLDAAPDLPASAWIHAATAGGADAVGARGYGRIRVGAAPGLLWLDAPGGVDDLRTHLPDRRWLATPGAPT